MEAGCELRVPCEAELMACKADYLLPLLACQAQAALERRASRKAERAAAKAAAAEQGNGGAGKGAAAEGSSSSSSDDDDEADELLYPGE